MVCTEEFTSYSDGFLKLIISPVEKDFKAAGFHRKRVGLNHFAFYAPTNKIVDEYCEQILRANNIKILYQDGASGDDDYYSALFEDPDRMKIEVVFAPRYCDKESWPNTIESDFNPYE